MKNFVIRKRIVSLEGGSLSLGMKFRLYEMRLYEAPHYSSGDASTSTNHDDPGIPQVIYQPPFHS